MSISPRTAALGTGAAVAFALLCWLLFRGDARESEVALGSPSAEERPPEPALGSHVERALEVPDAAEAAPSTAGAPISEPRADRAELAIEVFCGEPPAALPYVAIAVMPERGTDPFLAVLRSVTDESGRCVFADLEPGAWTAWLDRGVERSFELRAGERHTERFALELDGEVRGVVLDASRRAAPGADIWLGRGAGPSHDERKREAVVARSDAEGRFEIRGLSRGSHRIGASLAPHAPSDLVHVDVGAESSELELVLRAAGGALAGRVIDEERKGIAGAVVRIGHRFGWDGAQGIAGLGPPPRFLHTDGEGRFRVDGAPLGFTQVLARSVGRAPYSEMVEITSGPTTELVITLSAGVRLFGRVLDVAQQPIQGATIEVFGAARYEESRAKSSADGSYACSDLAPGSVQLQVRASGFERSRTVFQLAGGAAMRFDPVLIRALSIGGQLVDHEGRPLAGWGIGTDLGEGERRFEITGAEGRFLLAPLSPGNFALYLTPPDSLGILACTDLGPVPAGTSELLVRVPEGAFTASLRARYVHPGGAPIAGAYIILRTQAITQGMNARTEGDGRFELSGLAAGSYELELLHESVPAFRLSPIELATGASTDLGTLVARAHGKLEMELAAEAGFEPLDVFAEIEPAQGSEHATHAKLENLHGTAILEAGDYDVVIFGRNFVFHRERISIRANESTRLEATLRAGVQRQLVFPCPEPAWWREVSSFRAIATSRDGRVRFEQEFEADDLWPFTWWPSLLPGDYELRVEAPGKPVLTGAFTVETLQRSLQPIRVAMRESR